MCEELKELLAPEMVEFKIRLKEQDAQLADKEGCRNCKIKENVKRSWY